MAWPRYVLHQTLQGCIEKVRREISRKTWNSFPFPLPFFCDDNHFSRSFHLLPLLWLRLVLLQVAPWRRDERRDRSGQSRSRAKPSTAVVKGGRWRNRDVVDADVIASRPVRGGQLGADPIDRRVPAYSVPHDGQNGQGRAKDLGAVRRGRGARQPDAVQRLRALGPTLRRCGQSDRQAGHPARRLGAVRPVQVPGAPAAADRHPGDGHDRQQPPSRGDAAASRGRDRRSKPEVEGASELLKPDFCFAVA